MGTTTYAGYGGGPILSHGGTGSGGRSTFLHDHVRGLSFVYLFNTSWKTLYPPEFSLMNHPAAILEVADDVTAVNGWPSDDLFPWFGLAPIA